MGQKGATANSFWRRLWWLITITVIVILCILVWILWHRTYRLSQLQHGSQQTGQSLLDSLDDTIRQKINDVTQNISTRDSADRTVYIDGTKVVQVSAGNIVTNLTTQQNIQQVTNINTQNDTLADLSCAPGQIASFTGSMWACADPSSNTDNQQLALIANQLSIERGNSVDLGIYLDNTDLLASLACSSTQIIRFDGTNWYCSLDVDTDTNTDQQTLSWDDTTRTLDLTNGGSVIISDTNTTYSAGVGLSLIGTQFNLDPSSLAAVSSVANSDEIIIGTGSGARKITYNDLFGNILGALNYRGTWDANSNSPNLSAYCDSTTKGHYYVVSTSGNTSLGGFTGWENNDWVICDGATWQKIESLNAVSSVFGRTGAVTAQYGDYTASQVGFVPAGMLSSTNVQAAIEELSSDIAANAISAGAGLNLMSGTMSVSAPICSGTDKLTWNGSAFICSADKDTLATLSCGANAVPWWDSGLSKWQCTQINSYNIYDGTITLADLANNSVDTGKIVSDTIDFVDMADLMSLDATTMITLGSNDMLFNMNSSGSFKVTKSSTPILTVGNDATFLFQGSSDRTNSFTVKNYFGTP